MISYGVGFLEGSEAPVALDSIREWRAPSTGISIV